MFRLQIPFPVQCADSVTKLTPINRQHPSYDVRLVAKREHNQELLCAALCVWQLCTIICNTNMSSS